MKEVVKMISSVAPSLRVLSRSHFPTMYVRLATTQTSALAQLRKVTGYSVAKCKKALELHSGDIEKAEQWLHAEARKGGWSKMGSLQSRTAVQGLVGICTKNSSAAMVEVNCESDFVACNAEFQTFVGKVLSACVNHTVSEAFTQDFTKISLNSEQLNSLKFEDTNLADLVAMASGKFGERTVLKRATCIRTKGDVMLSSFVHPAKTLPELPGVVMGKFGALLAYQQKIGASDAVEHQTLVDLGPKICQHIVGMNPRQLGEFTTEDLNALQKKKQQRDVGDANIEQKLDSSVESEEKVPTEGDNEDSESSDEDDGRNELYAERNSLDTEESRLLHQIFLLDTTKVVGEVLVPLSVEIVDFERFECGENVDN